MRLLEYGGGTFQLHAGLLGEERRGALVSGPIQSCDHINITQSITSSPPAVGEWLEHLIFLFLPILKFLLIIVFFLGCFTAFDGGRKSTLDPFEALLNP